MKLKLLIGILSISLSAVAMAEAADPKPEKGTAAAKTAATGKPGVVKPVIDPVTGMELILVKGGCFQMGDVFRDGNPDQKPVHEVCLSDYYIGKYEVTQAQWQKVIGSNPASRKECGADCPIENLSWNMIQEFIAKLNSKSSIAFRLPTEAEWEYAARSGGKKEKWAGTDDEKKVSDFAWHDSEGKINKVGQMKPNSLGIHDMSGNIAEWCQDIYDAAYYGVSPKDNPVGPAEGGKRVVRGGFFGIDPKESTTTFRYGDDPAVWDGEYGFRLVRAVK